MLGMPHAASIQDAGVMALGERTDERGATPVEWVMVVALVLAAIVLVVTLGGSWVGDVA
jgi:hypothetical protein